MISTSSGASAADSTTDRIARWTSAGRPNVGMQMVSVGGRSGTVGISRDAEGARGPTCGAWFVDLARAYAQG